MSDHNVIDDAPGDIVTYLLCCNAWEEPEDFRAYADAVAAYEEYRRELERNGWEIEGGWASRDNLAAFRASKAIDSSVPNAFRFVQIVIDQE
jgi:hypothetical protein